MKLTAFSAAIIAALGFSAMAQSPVTLPGGMPKPNVAAEKPSTAGPSSANETKNLAPQTAPQVQGKAQDSAQATEQNRQNSTTQSTHNNSTSQNQSQTQQNQPQLQQRQSMQNPALGQNQAVPQQPGNLQDRRSDRSTFSQTQRDASASHEDRAQQDNAQDDRSDRSQRYGSNRDNRSQQSSSGSQARTHSANRANDLRGPDIGLWFDRSTRDGLLISDISSRGAISKLGFHEGDRIVSVNGHRVAREADFIQYLIGDNVATGPIDVVLVRDGRDETIQVNPSVLMQDYGYAEQADPLEQFGVVLDDRYNDKIVVWRVIPRSPAYYAGFRPGDELTTFHDQPLTTAQAFEQTIVGTNPGEVAVQVRRGDRNRNLTVDVPRFERGERRTAMRPNLERRDSYDPNVGQQSGQQYGSDSSINNQPNAAQQSDQQPSQQGYRSNRDSGSRRGMLRGNR